MKIICWLFCCKLAWVRHASPLEDRVDLECVRCGAVYDSSPYSWLWAHLEDTK